MLLSASVTKFADFHLPPYRPSAALQVWQFTQRSVIRIHIPETAHNSVSKPLHGITACSQTLWDNGVLCQEGRVICTRRQRNFDSWLYLDILPGRKMGLLTQILPTFFLVIPLFSAKTRHIKRLKVQSRWHSGFVERKAFPIQEREAKWPRKGHNSQRPA